MSTNPAAYTSLTGPALLSEPAWLPSDQGWLAWTYDPIGALNATAPGLGVPTLTRINVRFPVSVTNITMAVNAGGTTLTAGQNFAGLYNSAGTLVGATADQSGNWAGAFFTPQALIGGPFTLAAGFYWAAILANAAAAPTFLRAIAAASTTFINGANGPSTARFATNGSGQTTLPASITPASNTLIGVSYWAGLS